ncbi:MAG: stimulus-sensing domain-containing protein [Alphaproteobacteria bacterium]|nr:stimulus-sensing domain-containing protein [Alphaproteobacteria bacterium]
MIGKTPRRKRLLTRLIMINTLGLLGFLSGLLWLGQTRDSLTSAYRQTLNAQAQIMAEALGGLEAAPLPLNMPTQNNLLNAPAENNQQTISPAIDGKLMMPMIDRDEAAKMLRRIIAPTHNRARFYGRDGKLQIDSENLTPALRVQRFELPPPDKMPAPESAWWLKFWEKARAYLSRRTVPLLIQTDNGLDLEEVRLAMSGSVAGFERRDKQGRDILTIAVPVQHYRAIIGVLLLTSPPGAIDALVGEARATTIKLFLVILGITVFLSALLAGTITLPVQRLADAVRAYRSDGGALPPVDTIPDFSARRDEIGDLSLALREMLKQLTARLDAIEHFAADVAHELKNPITSLDSALQSLERTKDPKERKQLTEILIADTQRLNRLISDISEASRLDAALGRTPSGFFDIVTLLQGLAPLICEASPKQVQLAFSMPTSLIVRGQKERIAQIVRNLLDNALSFSPKEGRIQIMLIVVDDMAQLQFMDDGPGIAADLYERVFERFYTDGRETKHSGLGLSISRQIARAQGGDLWAGAHEKAKGACFTLTLPLANQADDDMPTDDEIHESTDDRL